MWIYKDISLKVIIIIVNTTRSHSPNDRSLNEYLTTHERQRSDTLQGDSQHNVGEQ